MAKTKTTTNTKLARPSAYQELADLILKGEATKFDIARRVAAIWLPSGDGNQRAKADWEEVHGPALADLGVTLSYQGARNYLLVGVVFDTDDHLIDGLTDFSYYRLAARMGGGLDNPQAARNVLKGYVQNAQQRGNPYRTEDLTAFLKAHNRKTGNTAKSRSGHVVDKSVRRAIEVLAELMVKPHFENTPDEVLQVFIDTAKAKATLAENHYNSKARQSRRSRAVAAKGSKATTKAKSTTKAKTKTKANTGPKTLRGK